ncbi:hypothetical protein BC567DRAFT_226609 [Phyllosticta citribraziliensis]
MDVVLSGRRGALRNGRRDGEGRGRGGIPTVHQGAAKGRGFVGDVVVRVGAQVVVVVVAAKGAKGGVDGGRGHWRHFWQLRRSLGQRFLLLALLAQQVVLGLLLCLFAHFGAVGRLLAAQEGEARVAGEVGGGGRSSARSSGIGLGHGNGGPRSSRGRCVSKRVPVAGRVMGERTGVRQNWRREGKTAGETRRQQPATR